MMHNLLYSEDPVKMLESKNNRVTEGFILLLLLFCPQSRLIQGKEKYEIAYSMIDIIE